MNVIRAKIISYWLLAVALPIIFFSEHRMFVPGVIALMALVRHSKPKLAQMPERFRPLACFLVLGCLVLLLIHAFHPFPPEAIALGKILAWLIIAPTAIYALYLDFRSFQRSEPSMASRP